MMMMIMMSTYLFLFLLEILRRSLEAAKVLNFQLQLWNIVHCRYYTLWKRRK